MSGTENKENLSCDACEARTAYERLTEQELANLGIVLGAYRSFRGNRRKHIAYVSMPITTGKLFYDVLIEAGVKSAKEFTEKFGKEALWEKIIKRNIEDGIKFTDELGKRDDLLYIAPSVFEAKPWKWTEDAYMSLWYRVLGELTGTHVLMDGWEYSTGGVKEVLFALMMQWSLVNPGEKEEAMNRAFSLKNFCPGLSAEEAQKEFEEMQKIRICDSSFSEIRIDTALEKICNAISKLHTAGFDDFSEKGPCVTLAHLAQSIRDIPKNRDLRDTWQNYESGGEIKAPKYPYDFQTELYKEANERLNVFGQMIQGR